MKAASERYNAVRFILDPTGNYHDVRELSIRTRLSGFIARRNGYRCAACMEPVALRAGVFRRPYFAHHRVDEETPSCPWRTHTTRSAFCGRNLSGDDGKWHIDVQCEIMTVLERLGLAPRRNANTPTELGLRKPDISVMFGEQLVHFEVQASPTDAWCATRRVQRDFSSGAVTIWIVSASAFLQALQNGTIPSWVDTLAALGGGRIWLWDEACYQDSMRSAAFIIKYAGLCALEEAKIGSFPALLPIVLPLLSRLDHRGRVKLFCDSGLAPRIAKCAELELDTVRSCLAEEQTSIAHQLNQTFRYDYLLAQVNLPAPIYRLLDGEERSRAKMVFNRLPRHERMEL